MRITEMNGICLVLFEWDILALFGCLLESVTPEEEARY
jgi:hypothetical protein